MVWIIQVFLNLCAMLHHLLQRATHRIGIGVVASSHDTDDTDEADDAIER